ncbi:AlbA family DNA-binding domain-containing protein [Streptomyces sp. cg40]|uniref:AlbA family DNA-binding domain-containing protein n=1 Tax=Streptomyces sp. cg40 TaxID=3419764 RepID=UPI003D00C3D7
MPNLAHPLFSAPADAVDTGMVRHFLSLELEENFTVEYKRNIAAADDTVGAMANTYGGVVLIGVDARPKDINLPGGLVGVTAADKDRLVSKMANTFDPPGWTPEVIPVMVDGKLLLVVRIDPDTVPQPLLHQGVVRIRLDGRNQTADRRLVQMMFQRADPAPATAYPSDPRLSPDQYTSPQNRDAYRKTPPDLIVRAAASRSLRRNSTRLRLHGTTVDALLGALGNPVTRQLPKRLEGLTRRVNSQLFQEPWKIDPEHGTAWFVRLAAGHDGPGEPVHPRVRAECTVALAQGGSSLEVLFDLLFWTGGQKIANDLWIQACYEAVHALAHNALPTLTEELLGTASVPVPPIELHIAAGAPNNPSLETLLNTDLLGTRIGTGDLRRGSDYLPEELVAVGDLPGAVTQTLRNIALDWRYLHPGLPTLHE